MNDPYEGARVKGKIAIATRVTMKADLTPAQRRVVVARIPVEMRYLFEERMVHTQWYPLAGTDEVVREVALQLGEDPEQYSLRLGRGLIGENLGVAARSFLALFASPNRIASYLPKTWRQLYDGGELTTSWDAAAGILVVERRNWPGHSPLHCFPLVGALTEFSRSMKGWCLVNHRRTHCLGHGAAMDRFELHYERA